MKKRILLLTISILLVPAVLYAGNDKVLNPEDELRQVRVGSPAVSPDGAWIAYSVSRYDVDKKQRESNIFLQPYAGGGPIQLTAMPGSESGYTWHPGGNKIAFSARRDGKSQIYVIDIRGGEARKITDIESGASSPRWSPDGKWIAFYSDVGELYTKEEKEAFGDVHYAKNLRYYHLGPGWDEGERQRIFLVPAAGGEAKQLTDGPCADEGDHSMAWSADSKEIAFVSNREKEWWNTIDTNVFAVNIESGETRQITTNVGPDHSPSYSPDGKWLAWRASFEYNYESENYKILIAPVGGGEPKILTAKLNRGINSIAWDPDSSRIYFSSSNEGYRHISFVNINEPDEFHTVTSGNYQVRGWRVAGSDKLAMLAGSDTEPYEVHTFTGGKLHKLTTDAGEFWKDYARMPSEEIWITTKDGARVQGWLIKPVGYEEGKKYPMILSIHGGPHGMYGPGLNFEYQMYAQRGIAVLFTNPRGSDGYGQEFADIIHGDWHTYPFADLMEFVDHVIAMGVADEKKLGVMGGSYGGYMTNWIIGNTDRFSSAVSVAGLSNMVSFYGATDEQFFVEKEMLGVPWVNREVYEKNSPIWYAGNFVTPTMVIQGENDWRVRPEQERQLFTALQKMGVPSVFVEFPGEQHGVGGATHRTVYLRLKLDWFGHWLQGKEPGLATYITPQKYEHPPKPYKSPKH